MYNFLFFPFSVFRSAGKAQVLSVGLELSQDTVWLGLPRISGSAPCASICVWPGWPVITQGIFSLDTTEAYKKQIPSYISSTDMSAKISHSQI